MDKKIIMKIFAFAIISISIGFILYFGFSGNVKNSPDSDCTTIKKSESREFNIAFLSYKYNSNEDFMKMVNSYVYGNNGFNNVEPFRSNFDKLSFYAVFSSSVMCNVEEGTLICDDYSAKRIASKCPNDFIFVLADRNSFVDALSPIRSSAYLNLASINTADHELVVLHEFAHLFGRLVDEYTDDISYKGLGLRNAPNCDNKECKKWEDFKYTECLKGCAISTYYRSKDFTIMRNYFKSNSFGAYNEWLLNKSLQR